jgi:hypothetical protein
VRSCNAGGNPTYPNLPKGFTWERCVEGGGRREEGRGRGEGKRTTAAVTAVPDMQLATAPCCITMTTASSPYSLLHYPTHCSIAMTTASLPYSLLHHHDHCFLTLFTAPLPYSLLHYHLCALCRNIGYMTAGVIVGPDKDYNHVSGGGTRRDEGGKRVGRGRRAREEG